MSSRLRPKEGRKEGREEGRKVGRKEGVARKSTNNPKAFWSHTRRKLITTFGVAPLLSKQKDRFSLRSDDGGQENILQKQFSSVITPEAVDDVLKIPNRTVSNIMDLHVTEEVERIY